MAGEFYYGEQLIVCSRQFNSHSYPDSCLTQSGILERAKIKIDSIPLGPVRIDANNNMLSVVPSGRTNTPTI